MTAALATFNYEYFPILPNKFLTIFVVVKIQNQMDFKFSS